MEVETLKSGKMFTPESQLLVTLEGIEDSFHVASYECSADETAVVMFVSRTFQRFVPSSILLLVGCHVASCDMTVEVMFLIEGLVVVACEGDRIASTSVENNQLSHFIHCRDGDSPRLQGHKIKFRTDDAIRRQLVQDAFDCILHTSVDRVHSRRNCYSCYLRDLRS